MGVVGTGIITLYDQNDSPIASLSLDRCALPADAAGVVSDFSGAVTTLSINRGGTDESSFWSVSVVKSAGLNGTLTGKTFTVTSLSTDAGYVDFTATRPGFSNLTKRFDVAKVKQGQPGDPGDPAQTFFLKAAPALFEYHHWGAAKTGQSILLTIERTNLTGTVTWSASAGVILPTGDLSKTLLPADVENAGDSFTITASCGGFSSTVTITKKRDEIPKSSHIGAVTAIPGTVGFVTGDTVLYVGTQTTDGNGLAWTPGNIYSFNEETARWYLDNSAENIARASFDVFAYADTIYAANPNADTITYIKNLVSANAAIKKLFSTQIVMDALGEILSSNYAEAADGSPTAGFKLISETGRIKAVLAELYQTTIYGSLIHDAFKTLDEQTGATVTFDSASRWFGGDLYNALSGIAVDGALASCAGTVYGNTVNQASRRSAAGSFSAVAISRTSVDSTTYTYAAATAGTYKFLFIDAYWTDWLYQYRKIARWQVNGTPIYSGTTGQGGIEVTVTLAAGDVVSVYVHGHRYNYFSDAGITVDTWAKFAHQKGVLFANSSSPFTLQEVPFQAFFTSAKSASMTSPATWASASNLQYAPGTTFVNAVSGFTPGVNRVVTGTLSIDGTNRTASAICSQSGGALITHSGGTTLVYAPTAGEGVPSGYYKISGSIVFQAQSSSIATKQIVPKAHNTYDIGSDTVRFRDLFLARALYVAGAITGGGGNISGFGSISAASLSLTGAISAASLALGSGALGCGVVTPSRVDCYGIDDDTAPLGSKSTTTTLNFTVYKPILVRLYSSVETATSNIGARYNGAYLVGISNLYGATSTDPRIGVLLPGNYQLSRQSQSGTAYIQCLAVYGANSASTFWS